MYIKDFSYGPNMCHHKRMSPCFCMSIMGCLLNLFPVRLKNSSYQLAMVISNVAYTFTSKLMLENNSWFQVLSLVLGQ